MTAASTLLLTSLALASGRTPYQQGVAAFESGNLTNARAWLAEVDVREEPHAGFLLGVVAERQRSYVEAVRLFDEYLHRVGPRSDLIPAARAHRAYCLASAGHADEVISYLTTAPATPDRPLTFLLGYADLIVAHQAKRPVDRKAAALRAVTRFTRLTDRPGSEDAEAFNALGLSHLALAALDKNSANRTSLKNAATTAFTRAAALSKEGDPIHQSAMRGSGQAKDLAR